jgi:hypothetical protein
MDYRKFITTMVEIYKGYATKYPKSTYVRYILDGYTAMLNNEFLDTIPEVDDKEIEEFLDTHRNFDAILMANPEMTIEQEQRHEWHL